MEKQIIDNAILSHGASRVYYAAADRLASKRQEWQAVGLPESKHLGEVNDVMVAAFALMSKAEKRGDYRSVKRALAI